MSVLAIRQNMRTHNRLPMFRLDYGRYQSAAVSLMHQVMWLTGVFAIKWDDNQNGEKYMLI
jgi:hypothetical protein